MLLIALAVVAYALAGSDTLGTIFFIAIWAAFFSPLPLALLTATVGGLFLIAFWGLTGGGIAIYVPTVVMIFASRRLQKQATIVHRLQKESLVAADRDRMARDLHDTVGQSITALNLRLQVAQQLFEQHPNKAKEELKQCQQLASDTLSDLRLTVADLHVPDLDTEIRQVEDNLRKAGISVDAKVNPDIDTSLRVPMAWILREATTNIIRHAHASQCQIVIDNKNLKVSDNGVGIGSGRQLNNGLKNMQFRAESSGGRLEIHSSPLGTTIHATWPEDP